MSDTLDAGSNPPQGVAPQPTLRLFVGNPPREMLILSGVAFPDWGTDTGHLVQKEIVIKLGATTTPRFQAAATVALVAIYNTDSDLIFAADDCNVTLDEQGQLELHVQLGLMGEKSVLLKINYHVQVLSDRLESLVSGTIRWAEIWGSPSLQAETGNPALFRVAAGHFVQNAAGANPFGATHWEERAAAWSGKPQHVNGRWTTPYIIHGVPLGEALQIVPSYLDNLDRPTNNNELPRFLPPRAIQLSPSLPALTDVDFELDFTGLV